MDPGSGACCLESANLIHGAVAVLVEQVDRHGHVCASTLFVREGPKNRIVERQNGSVASRALMKSRIASLSIGNKQRGRNGFSRVHVHVGCASAPIVARQSSGSLGLDVFWYRVLWIYGKKSESIREKE
jgi:hypothetical protein